MITINELTGCMSLITRCRVKRMLSSKIENDYVFNKDTTCAVSFFKSSI